MSADQVKVAGTNYRLQPDHSGTLSVMCSNGYFAFGVVRRTWQSGLSLQIGVC
jgi:hypothetical protein